MFARLYFVKLSKILISTIFLFFAAIAQVQAQDVCSGVTCENVKNSICSEGGFKITLTDFIPGNISQDGSATYVYEICSTPAGQCDTGPAIGNSCLDDGQCSKSCNQNNHKCQGTQAACTDDADCAGTCDRECGIADFHGLSHVDVLFPELGGIESCLSETNTVEGSCECSQNTSGTCSVGNFVLGDGSCFDGGTSSSFLAKCDNTNLGPGDCVEMTLNIAGELNGLGLGTAVVVDKAANTCTSSCMAGPSCDDCDGEEGGEECLTRTIGFWGTHPWITNNYDPVTVCGKPLGCDGDDALDNTACSAGTCDSIIEGLCSVPGQELPSNQPYVTLVRQLTAAKLNLNATSELFAGANCSDFEFEGKTIQEWITFCEGLCGANKATISSSGCIEALDAFNNSEDVGFQQTPPPFDRPPLDDNGMISGADHTQCGLAQGNNKKTKLVIGKSVGSNNCQ